MLETSQEWEERRRLPRLLPKDDKIHYALADCQRDLESARSQLLAFRERWFVADPPQREEARAASLELTEAAVRLRNSARELARLARPTVE